MHEIWIPYETPLFNFYLITNFLLPPSADPARGRHSGSYLSTLPCLLHPPPSPQPPPYPPSQHPYIISSVSLPLSYQAVPSPALLSPMCAIFLLCTCPNHLSLSSLTFVTETVPICAVPLTVHSSCSQWRSRRGKPPTHFFFIPQNFWGKFSRHGVGVSLYITNLSDKQARKQVSQ